MPDFTLLNGYYAWEQVINDGSGLHRSIVRQDMSSFQTDAAIDWIRKQSQGGRANRPWMATVSYDAIHTPYQPPPDDLYPPGFVWPPGIPQDCTSTEAVRILSNLMAEAMDKEIGRLLARQARRPPRLRRGPDEQGQVERLRLQCRRRDRRLGSADRSGQFRRRLLAVMGRPSLAENGL